VEEIALRRGRRRFHLGICAAGHACGERQAKHGRQKEPPATHLNPHAFLVGAASPHRSVPEGKTIANPRRHTQPEVSSRACEARVVRPARRTPSSHEPAALAAQPLPPSWSTITFVPAANLSQRSARLHTRRGRSRRRRRRVRPWAANGASAKPEYAKPEVC